MGARITCTGNAAYGRFPVPVVAPPTMSRPRSPRSAPQASIIILARARATTSGRRKGYARARRHRNNTATRFCVRAVFFRCCRAHAWPLRRPLPGARAKMKTKTCGAERRLRRRNMVGEATTGTGNPLCHITCTHSENTRARARSHRKSTSYTHIHVSPHLIGSAAPPAPPIPPAPLAPPTPTVHCATLLPLENAKLGALCTLPTP